MSSKNLSELLNQGAEVLGNLVESLKIPSALRSAQTVAQIGVALTVLEGCPKNPDLTMENDVTIEKQDMAEVMTESLTVEMARELDKIAPLTAIKAALDAHSIILDLSDKQGIIPTGDPERDVYYVNISYLIKEYLQNGGSEDEAKAFIESYKATRIAAFEKQLMEENAKMKEAEPNKLRGIASAERAFFAAEKRIESLEEQLGLLKEYEFPNFAERSDEDNEESSMGKYEKQMREFISRAEKVGTSRESLIEKLNAEIERLDSFTENEGVNQMDIFNARALALKHIDAAAAELMELRTAYEERGSVEAKEVYEGEDEAGVVYDRPKGQLVSGAATIDGGMSQAKYGDYTALRDPLFKWENDPAMLPIVRKELLRMTLEIFAREIMAWETMTIENPKKIGDFPTLEAWRKSLATASERLSKIDRKVRVLSEGNFGARKLDLDEVLLKIHADMNTGSETKYRLDSLEMFRRIMQLEAFVIDSPIAFEKLSDEDAREEEIRLAKAKPCYLKGRSAATSEGAYLCNGTIDVNGDLRYVGVQDMIEEATDGDRSLYYVVTGYKGSETSKPFFIPDTSAEVKLSERLTRGMLETVARDEVANRLKRGEMKVVVQKPRKEKPVREEEEED